MMYLAIIACFFTAIVLYSFIIDTIKLKNETKRLKREMKPRNLIEAAQIYYIEQNNVSFIVGEGLK